MIFSLVCLICCTNVAITKHQIIEITVRIVINCIIVTHKLQTSNNIKTEKIKSYGDWSLAVIHSIVYRGSESSPVLPLIVELINDTEEKA